MIDILNGLISVIGNILTWIINLLPNSPFGNFSTSSISEYLGNLTWLVPVHQMIILGTTWLGAIGIYYIYQVVLRWVKAIE